MAGIGRRASYCRHRPDDEQTKEDDRMDDLIAKLKAIAQKHYNEGGDVFIECYDDSDWHEFIALNPANPVKRLHTIMGIYHDRQQDAENSAF